MNKQNIVAIILFSLISVFGIYVTHNNLPINKAQNHFNNKLKELREINRLMGETLLSIDYDKQEDLVKSTDKFSYYKLELMEVVNLIEVNVDNKNKIKSPKELFIPQRYVYYSDQIKASDLMIKKNKEELVKINKSLKSYSTIVDRSQKLLHELIESLFLVYKFR